MATAVCAASVPFGAKVDYGAGSTPQSVAVGDFNGDGNPDLAVPNSGSGTVSILLGNGNGTFAAKVDYGVGSTPQSVAVGDFNGDGNPDLAVPNSGSGTVSILLGNGNGTFAAKVDYGVGSTPQSVAIGDFNGDGKIDVAVPNDGDNTVSVLLGNGNGTFGAKVDYGAGSTPQSVAVGDFNGDGNPDLAVANNGDNTVSVLLGKGDGTFSTKADYGVGSFPAALVVGDFNRDGSIDLAVVNNGDNTVSVLLGKGNGTFGVNVSYPTGSGPFFVAVGDLNRDGSSDLVVANSNNDTLSALLGKGDGTFGAKTDYGTGSGPQSVAVGDFNRDGNLDLVTANLKGNTVSVLLSSLSPAAPSGAVISQFRLAGPNGPTDEFIELANTTASALLLDGWSVAAGGVTVPISGSLPAGGHLLLANSGGYSLGAIATGDVSYTGDIPTNSPLTLKNAAGTAVDSVSDLSATAAPTSATAQYAYLRRLETGAPAKTGNDSTDFNLADTAANASTAAASGVGTLTAARLGSPNPHNTASTVQRNDGISNSPLNIGSVYTAARYASKGSGVDSKGRLSIRRTITNSTGAAVSKLRFRVVAITGGASGTAGVADLRAISSGGVRYYDNTHTIQRAAYGMTLDAPTTPNEAPLTSSSSGKGGGLNASWTAQLPGGTLAAGASVNVEFLFGIQAEGKFRIVVDAEVLP